MNQNSKETSWGREEAGDPGSLLHPSVEIGQRAKLLDRTVDIKPDRAPGATRIVVYSDIMALPPLVQAFVAEHFRDELCLSGNWFELLARFASAMGQKPRIYVVGKENEEAIDCVVFGLGTDGNRRPRKLSSLTNFYTMSYAPLLRHGLADAESIFDGLTSYIARERPAWDVIELQSLIKEHPETDQLVKAFRKTGMLVDTYFQFENWIYPSDGVSAEDYFKSRPPPVRAVTRKTRQAQKKHDISFQLYDSLENLSVGLQDYEQVYAHSWKTGEAYPEFIPQLLRRFAAERRLRLGVLRFDGEPTAAQIWFVTGRRATIYKVAYDEKFAPLSPGSILSKMMFEYLLDHDKVAEIDYGVGSESYKLDWMTECRHVVGLICYNPRSGFGLLAAASHFTGKLVRRMRANAPQSGGVRTKS